MSGRRRGFSLGIIIRTERACERVFLYWRSFQFSILEFLDLTEIAGVPIEISSRHLYESWTGFAFDKRFSLN
jgi:hypothetical protein